MKQNTKWIAAVAAVVTGLAAVESTQAQGITGGAYLNIPTAGAGYSGNWNAGDATATATGLEFVAAGGTGSFSTFYNAIPVGEVQPNDPVATQVVFDFTITGATFAAGVNVLFALDDSLGGTAYYGTGYTITADGSYSETDTLMSPNSTDIAGGATITGVNFQIDPANISGNYNITFNSLTLEPAAVPEPAPMALAGVGAACFMFLRRRK